MVRRRGLLQGAAAAAGAVAAATDFMKRDGTRTLAATSQKRALIMLDRSGSMARVRQATVDGLNAFLDDQRDKPDLRITLLQFDAPMSDLEITETFVDLPADLTPSLGIQDFEPRGNTPLRVAVVDAISRLEKQAGPDDKLLLVFQTDGADTCSPAEISHQVVKDLIEAKQALGNWTIVFLGANIDAWSEGGAIGVVAGNTQSYQNTYPGTVEMYATSSASTNAWYGSNTKATLDFFNQDEEKK